MTDDPCKYGSSGDTCGPLMSYDKCICRLEDTNKELVAALESAIKLVGEVVTGDVTKDDFNTGLLASYRDEFETALKAANGETPLPASPPCSGGCEFDHRDEPTPRKCIICGHYEACRCQEQS